jgi:hypothetical protein
MLINAGLSGTSEANFRLVARLTHNRENRLSMRESLAALIAGLRPLRVSPVVGIIAKGVADVAIARLGWDVLRLVLRRNSRVILIIGYLIDRCFYCVRDGNDFRLGFFRFPVGVNAVEDRIGIRVTGIATPFLHHNCLLAKVDLIVRPKVIGVRF